MEGSNKKKGVVVGVLGLLMLGTLMFLYIWSGHYNIAASEPHWRVTEDLIRIMTEASIRNHAQEIPIRDTSSKPGGRQSGSALFDEMCVDCHGAPGIGRSEFGQGMYPLAPALSELRTDWSDEELFWIIENGIKMTGMPAFGKTHSDEEIWQIVDFVRELPDISYYDYLDLQESKTAEAHQKNHQ